MFSLPPYINFYMSLTQTDFLLFFPYQFFRSDFFSLSYVYVFIFHAFPQSPSPIRALIIATHFDPSPNSSRERTEVINTATRMAKSNKVLAPCPIMSRYVFLIQIYIYVAFIAIVTADQGESKKKRYFTILSFLISFFNYFWNNYLISN